MSNSLYLKYRPVQLSDIVEQKNVVNILKQQAIKDSFSHAYLLFGQFGGGKTTTARILASLMTCPNREGDVVCGKCRSCVAIHNGHCCDVYEMDAASKRGIDDARKIRETANFPPQELKKKVYILDESHKITDDAWNALLKTIEEPPPFICFIFCTTEHKKVPNTIMSRCQRFIFNPIPVVPIVNQLKDIAKKEKIQIDDNNAMAIAKASKGSLRDAINYLEQISVLKNNNIKGDDVLVYFGLPEERISYEIVELIINQNPVGLLEKIDDVLKCGVDVKTILFEITNIFRNIFVCKNCGKDSKLLDLLDSEKELIAKLTDKISLNVLTKIASTLYRIEKEISLNINERWIMEAALISCLMLVKGDANNKK